MQNQRGSVSIFIVVFSALFVTIITVSFVSLMIRGQQQALSADLSNSAYDSALTGVEDAKQVLLKYRQCLRTMSAYTNCPAIVSSFGNPSCGMVKEALVGSDDGKETLIESKSESVAAGPGNSSSLDQAYTCVQIDYLNDFKETELADGESELIPIDSRGERFTKVRISWFQKSQGMPSTLVNRTNTLMPDKDTWDRATPPILRTQLIQHGTSFNSGDFDADQTNGSNTKTAFLYPLGGFTVPTVIDLNAVDNRSATAPGLKSPEPINCRADRYAGGEQYPCVAEFGLPDPTGSATNRSLYLQLQPLYNGAKIRVELIDSSGTVVQMVAPTIDSTGRANDLFRRVKVGVSFNGDYPKATFDVRGNLCKDFWVTNTEFNDNPSCRVTP